MTIDQCALVDVQIRDLEALRRVTVTPLDKVYEEVNALGGYVARGDVAGEARTKFIEEVLAIIERHGGRDPLSRVPGAH